jgi:hypothetical protein
MKEIMKSIFKDLREKIEIEDGVKIVAPHRDPSTAIPSSVLFQVHVFQENVFPFYSFWPFYYAL